MALSQMESAHLMMDGEFRGRVKVACLTYASRILQGGTGASQAAIRWANQTFQQPDQASGVAVGPAVMEPGVQESGSNIDDGGLQFAVENAVNKTL